MWHPTVSICRLFVENMIAPRMFLLVGAVCKRQFFAASRYWVEDCPLERMVGFGFLGTGAAVRQPTLKVAGAYRQDDPFERRLVRTR